MVAWFIFCHFFPQTTSIPLLNAAEAVVRFEAMIPWIKRELSLACLVPLRRMNGVQYLLEIVRVSGWRSLGGLRDYYLFGIETQARGAYAEAKLPGVTTLDVSTSPRASNKQVHYSPLMGLSLLLPNLRNVDLSNVSAPAGVIKAFCKNSPNLHRVAWNYSRSLIMDGKGMATAANLTELFVDHSRLDGRSFRFMYEPQVADLFEEEQADDMMNLYLFMDCRRLERLSMKNVSWFPNIQQSHQPLSQGMLIKLV